MDTTAPWPAGLAPPSASLSPVLGCVRIQCLWLPRGPHWPGASLLAPLLFRLGAQPSVLALREPSDPGLVLVHPTTCYVSPAPQPGTRGPRGPS